MAVPTIESDLELIKRRLPETDVEGRAIIDAVLLQIEKLREYEWMYKDLNDE